MYFYLTYNYLFLNILFHPFANPNTAFISFLRDSCPGIILKAIKSIINQTNNIIKTRNTNADPLISHKIADLNIKYNSPTKEPTPININSVQANVLFFLLCPSSTSCLNFLSSRFSLSKRSR